MTDRADAAPKGPGLTRRIAIHPLAGAVSAGLEDDLHCFKLRLTHDGRAITAVEARAERHPWSTCPGAAGFIAEQAVGQPLDAIRRLDIRSHCTHLFELALLAAAHALDPAPVRFDLWVADRVDDKTRATLAVNGEQVLAWAVTGNVIDGPDLWAGRDLRKLSTWRAELTPTLAEQAMLMRRAVHVSGGRRPEIGKVQRATELGPSRLGACFTYQATQIENATRTPNWRQDFSRMGVDPLQSFDPSWS